MEPKYKRVLLKLSGEAMAGDQHFGINPSYVKKVAAQVKEVAESGVEVAIVVGGGNFWRGRNGHQMERTTADYMGMLATTMNGLALQDTIEKKGIDTRLQTAIEMRQIAEPFINRRAIRHIEKNRIVIFAAGTGSPYFSTDTAAALRACEIHADVILVAKTIDGVYSADPKVDSNAIKYKHITYKQILEQDLKVMDSTSISLCKDNNIPLKVFAMKDPQNIIRAVKEEDIGTTVDNIEE